MRYDELGLILQPLLYELIETLHCHRLALWISRTDGRYFLEDPPEHMTLGSVEFPPPASMSPIFRNIGQNSIEVVNSSEPPQKILILEVLYPRFFVPPIGYPRELESDSILYSLLEPDAPLVTPLRKEQIPALEIQPEEGELCWAARLQIRSQVLGLAVFSSKARPLENVEKDFRAVWQSQIHRYERLQLEATLARRTASLQAIQSLGNTITSQFEIHDILQSVVEQATILMKAKTASLMLVDAEGQQLVLESVYGSSPDYIRKPNLDIDNSLIGRVVRTGRPVMVRDVRNCDSYQHRELARSEGLVSLLSAPLKWRETCMGALNVYSARRYRYTQDNIYLLELLASQSAIAIQNARTLSQARHLEEHLHELDKRSLVGELAAGVAHEIRNPLAVVKMLIDSWEAHDETEAEDIRVISTQLKGINRCVSQLLEISRQRPIEKASLRIQQEIPAICQLLRIRLREQDVAAQHFIPEDLQPVCVDAPRFRQMFMNLFLNSLNAMEKGGHITIRAALCEPERFDEIFGQTIVGLPSFSGRDPGQQYALITYSDSGGGMQCEDVAVMFQPFMTGSPEGFGLGLSVVRRIVEDHSFGLKVKNSPGSGLTFFILMPTLSEDREVG